MAYTSAKWKKFPAKLTGPPLPQRLHNLYVLPGALAPLGEIFPQGVKLLLEPTDPYTEEKAPAIATLRATRATAPSLLPGCFIISVTSWHRAAGEWDRTVQSHNSTVC